MYTHVQSGLNGEVRSEYHIGRAVRHVADDALHHALCPLHHIVYFKCVVVTPLSELALLDLGDFPLQGSHDQWQSLLQEIPLERALNDSTMTPCIIPSVMCATRSARSNCWQ